MKHHRAGGLFQCAPTGRTTWSRSGPLYQLMAVVLAWSPIGVSSLPAQQPKATAYEVKAVYLYNFGKFVEWPAKVTAGNNEPFTICVLGKDPFGASLDSTIAGEAIDGRSILAKRISKPQEALNCRVLFISSSEEVQLKEILATLETTSVLTVSDMSQFTRRGGMIQFVDDANRVRFEVNLTVVERAGLTLSSQLLKVAVSAKRYSQPGD
jgi:YfiR/HmsC-like